MPAQFGTDYSRIPHSRKNHSGRAESNVRRYLAVSRLQFPWDRDCFLEVFPSFENRDPYQPPSLMPERQWNRKFDLLDKHKVRNQHQAWSTLRAALRTRRSPVAAIAMLYLTCTWITQRAHGTGWNELERKLGSQVLRDYEISNSPGSIIAAWAQIDWIYSIVVQGRQGGRMPCDAFM